jgi:hypothetical protein
MNFDNPNQRKKMMVNQSATNDRSMAVLLVPVRYNAHGHTPTTCLICPAYHEGSRVRGRVCDREGYIIFLQQLPRAAHSGSRRD